MHDDHLDRYRRKNSGSSDEPEQVYKPKQYYQPAQHEYRNNRPSNNYRKHHEENDLKFEGFSINYSRPQPNQYVYVEKGKTSEERVPNEPRNYRPNKQHQAKLQPQHEQRPQKPYNRHSESERHDSDHQAPVKADNHRQEREPPQRDTQQQPYETQKPKHSQNFKSKRPPPQQQKPIQRNTQGLDDNMQKHLQLIKLQEQLALMDQTPVDFLRLQMEYPQPFQFPIGLPPPNLPLPSLQDQLTQTIILQQLLNQSKMFPQHPNIQQNFNIQSNIYPQQKPEKKKLNVHASAFKPVPVQQPMMSQQHAMPWQQQPMNLVDFDQLQLLSQQFDMQ